MSVMQTTEVALEPQAHFYRAGKITAVTITKAVRTPQEQEDEVMANDVTGRIPRAEDRLCLKFRGLIYSVLVKLTADPAKAEDLTHETLILVIEKLRNGELEKPHKLTSFVLSIAKYSYFGWLRKKDNQVELRESLSELEGEYSSPEDECVAQENRLTLARLIECLPTERDREILQRAYLNEQSKKEICDAMTLTHTHYDRVISRARTRLKRYAMVS